jgi:hypothetical protein
MKASANVATEAAANEETRREVFDRVYIAGCGEGRMLRGLDAVTGRFKGYSHRTVAKLVRHSNQH